MRLILFYFTLPVAIIFTIINPFYGLIVLALQNSIRPDIWGASGFFLRPQFLFTIVTAGSLLFNRSGKYKIRLNTSIFIFILLAIWLILNSRNALVSRTIALEYGIRFLKLVVLLWLVTSLANSPKRINITLWIIVLGLAWLSKSVFVQYIFEGRIRVDPLGGGGAGGNAMATSLCMLLPFLLYKIFEGKRWEKNISAVLIIIWIFDLIAIASRGGFLALLLAILLFFIKHKKKAKFALFIILIAGSLSIFGSSYFWNRMASLSDYQADSSAANRLVLWKAALDIFNQYPMCGVGTKNFSLLSKQYTGIESQTGAGLVAHNSYLELLAENGFPGLSLYLLAIGTALILLRKSRSLPEEYEHKEEIVYLSHVMEIGIIVFLFRGLTGTNYLADILYWFLGMAGGLVYYVKIFENKTEKNIKEISNQIATNLV